MRIAEAKQIVCKAKPTRSFKIVGVGASAGGLAAFTAFLGHLPAETGLAYVLVQHLDPTRRSLLSEILGKTTTLPVREISHGIFARSNHIYVIPPNRNLTVERES
ncbi:MAG: chemotaxis protein CheB [Limisphaerales bacterium]